MRVIIFIFIASAITTKLWPMPTVTMRHALNRPLTFSLLKMGLDEDPSINGARQALSKLQSREEAALSSISVAAVLISDMRHFIAFYHFVHKETEVRSSPRAMYLYPNPLILQLEAQLPLEGVMIQKGTEFIVYLASEYFQGFLEHKKEEDTASWSPFNGLSDHEQKLIYLKKHKCEDSNFEKRITFSTNKE